MSERDQEGWEAPWRGPLIALAIGLAVLLGGVVAGGTIYRARIQRLTHPPVAALDRLPAPRLETIETAPGERRGRRAAAPSPAIARAMADVAAQGDTLWGGARP